MSTIEITLTRDDIERMRVLVEDCRTSEDPRDPSGTNWERIGDDLTQADVSVKGGARRVRISQDTLDWIVSEFAWMLAER